MAVTWEVKTSYIYIRSKPDKRSPILGGLKPGEKVTQIETKVINGQAWLHHNRGGWSIIKNKEKIYLAKSNPDEAVKLSPIKSDYGIMPIVLVPSDPGTGGGGGSTGAESGESGSGTGSSGSTVDSYSNNEDLNNSDAYDPTIDELGGGYQPGVEEFLGGGTSIANSEFFNIRNVLGVFGLPYQFLPNTDPRILGVNSDNVGEVGYEYANKIVQRMPLLFLTPGKASFMTKFSRQNKENILSTLLTQDQYRGIGSSTLDNLLDSSGRYYTFERDSVRYYKFVNPMCRIAARYLNLQDEDIDGVPLDRVNWENYANRSLSAIGGITGYGAVPFYMEAETSISENFSNSTTQSMIASTVNSISDMGRELNFLMGYGVGYDTDKIFENPEVQSLSDNISNLVQSILGNGSFLTDIGKHLVTVASGGKLMFPEIWSDSSFSRSYSCRFKFISPDPSKLSIYLNVLVPLFHLIGLVAPQSTIENPNGYTNPFIIRAIYKGGFNIDMGLITSMSVTKGAECQWTPDGIPTSIEVSIDIKDLYNNLSITPTENTSWSYDTMNNTALMDYIATLCGINSFKPDIARMVDMWMVNNVVNRVEDFFQTDIFSGLTQWFSNGLDDIYSYFR